MQLQKVVAMAGQISAEEYERLVKSIDSRLKNIDDKLEKTEKTQTTILINQNNCDHRHEEGEMIANADRQKINTVEAKVSEYEKSLIKAAAAVIFTFGIGGAGLYTLIPTPPPAETPQPIPPPPSATTP